MEVVIFGPTRERVQRRAARDGKRWAETTLFQRYLSFFVGSGRKLSSRHLAAGVAPSLDVLGIGNVVISATCCHVSVSKYKYKTQHCRRAATRHNGHEGTAKDPEATNIGQQQNSPRALESCQVWRLEQSPHNTAILQKGEPSTRSVQEHFFWTCLEPDSSCSPIEITIGKKVSNKTRWIHPVILSTLALMEQRS